MIRSSSERPLMFLPKLTSTPERRGVFFGRMTIMRSLLPIQSLSRNMETPMHWAEQRVGGGLYAPVDLFHLVSNSQQRFIFVWVFVSPFRQLRRFGKLLKLGQLRDLFSWHVHCGEGSRG